MSLEKFTYLKKLFWLCLFGWLFMKAYLPSQIEIKRSIFYFRLQKIVFFAFVAIFFLVRAGSLFFENSTALFFWVLPNPNASIILPAQEVPQDVLWNDLDARERELAAEREAQRQDENARIEREVEAMRERCTQIQKSIVEKTHSLLVQAGYIIEDDDDIRRVIDVAMVDHEEIDIDHRVRHYRNLRSYLGKPHSKFWQESELDSITLLEDHSFFTLSLVPAGSAATKVHIII